MVLYEIYREDGGNGITFVHMMYIVTYSGMLVLEGKIQLWYKAFHFLKKKTITSLCQYTWLAYKIYTGHAFVLYNMKFQGPYFIFIQP